MLQSSEDRYRDIGVLLIRLGLGVMYILHGYPKIAGGPETWTSYGQAMGHFGIHFFPAFWGLMAGLAEFGGGILLIVGWLFRPACALIMITMIVATVTMVSGGQPFMAMASRPLEMAIVFLGLLVIGPGRFAFNGRPDTWR